MEETQEQPSLISSAVKNGLILGVISIVLTLVIYSVDYTIMVQLKYLALVILIAIGYAVYAGIGYRKEVGGYLSFGKAFQHGFFLFAVSGFISIAFNLILHNVIDPELGQKLVEASLENTRSMLEGFGMSGEQLDQAMADAEIKTEGQFSTGSQLLGYIFYLIFGAIGALISGAIVKKNQPISF